MEKICIVSRDKRFAYARELFINCGYECEICEPFSLKDGDIILFSPKNNFTDHELRKMLSDVDHEAIIFTGKKEKVEKHHAGIVLDYSDSESFLLDNAYITAQCAIKLTFENTDFSLHGKRVLVLGYGRIGKYLSSMLKCLCADVFVYARREESQKEASLNGFGICELSEIDKLDFDLIYNTVPFKIVKREITDKLRSSALIMELASDPGGFYDENIALKAAALPGKLMPQSAGKAIFDYVISILSHLKGENNL